jgi:DNA-binding IclR family transcriptional regulator
MQSRTRSYSVPALEKAIDIIELLAHAPQAMTLSAMAGALSRSTSEIFRVVHTLERRGYLARGADDRYVLTNRLFEQGLQRPSTASLLEVAYPEMRALAAAIAQSCHISVPSGDVMVTVARVEDQRAASFVVPIGFRVPLAESASGRVFLAFLPEAERTVRLAEMGQAVRSRLARALPVIRRRGYELAPSASVVGVTDLSFPLFEADARPVAFLGVPLAARRREPKAERTVIALVQEAAGRIDASLARLRR